MLREAGACSTESVRALLCDVLPAWKFGSDIVVTRSFVPQPMGASDYLEMARLFDTVFIRRVPILTLSLKDQARRFTTLIDNFYDNKVCG